MKIEINPIADKERIHSIDVIRGFALLGIFLVNMAAFHSPDMYKGDSENLGTIEQFIRNGIDIFAQASFYTLFSFLFGFGMVIFIERAREKGLNYKSLFVRRLLVLLLIGAIHAFLIWHGDILITYALIGIILLFFSDARTKTLLASGLMILLIPAVLLSGLLFYISFLSPDSATLPKNETLYQESIENYKYGDFLKVTSQRLHDWYYVNNLENFLFLVVAILPLFLLGAYVARKKWFSEVQSHKGSIQKMWFLSLMIGIPIKVLPYITAKSIGTDFLQDSIGGPALALFYGTSIVLLMEEGKWRKLLLPFSYVGRLSLTNYLLQSIICTTIFYGYGLGLYGEINHLQGLLLTLFIFIIQIVFSYLWLKKFSYGPMEWVWRSLTYGKTQVLRREKYS
jgi:uncharacterized protein